MQSSLVLVRSLVHKANFVTSAKKQGGSLSRGRTLGSRLETSNAFSRRLHVSRLRNYAPPRDSNPYDGSNESQSRQDDDGAEDTRTIYKIIAANTTNAGYNLRSLHERIHSETGLTSVYPPTTRPRVLYLTVRPGDESPKPDAPVFAKNKSDLIKSYFWFEDGTIVAWAASDEDFKSILAFTSPETQNDIKFYERLSFRFSTHAGYDANKDLIHLSTNKDLEDSIGEMLAFSHGIARSVKLDAMEALVETAVSEIGQKIPNFFMQGARLKWFDNEYNTQEINKKIGKIMKLRWDINVRTDLGETPDYLWEEEPKHERLYTQVEKALDLRSRLGVLNKKLKMADEDLAIINNYISTQHGAMMELIIILLISIEVLSLLLEKFGAWHDFRWEWFFGEYLGWGKKEDAKKPQELAAEVAKKH
eukprot:TRINITY_DN238_c0_g1_i1.p1 TRINITY_DN238_c0_g1~~TRINITY_DN238_c0_g1_i1.p1  ORF type:complete len:419 (+),score=100.47 TRINITY_DN238_c0_g1_i1:310-1566(+)